MIKDRELAIMTVADLSDLLARVKTAISAKQAEERLELKNRLADIARDAGYSVSELFGGKVKTGKAIAYRHPKNPSLTWSGRGRRPLWLSKELDGGAKLEEMAA